MDQLREALQFSIEEVGAHFGNVTIEVPNRFVKKLYDEASLAQQSESYTYGFSKGEAPLSYIKDNFQPHLIEHIKEFLFRYFIVSWLHEKLVDQKILIAGEPRLTEVNLRLNDYSQFKFSLTLARPISLQGWKRLPFKAPKRKNYKDLDRQVENFLKDEANALKNYKNNGIDVGDWVNFTISVIDKKECPLFSEHHEDLWIKVGTEEADAPFQDLFLGKKKGEIFLTKSQCLQEYFSTHIDTNYLFKVSIIDFVPQSFFDIEQFKKHFRIRNNKELHQKLIEVFSYRNDISQRRAMTEEALRLLLTRHVFDVPNHLILRRQKELLDLIHGNPDYQVYKMLPDFNEKIRMLATKQVKEGILTRQLAVHENLSVTNDDIKRYLNLTKRPRIKEFIYFELPETKIQGQEFPVSSAIVKDFCLQEKALNHIIYHLTKAKGSSL